MSNASDLFHREQPPLLILISGPSGVGKDSVVDHMKERGCSFDFVITATDREPRETEVHGRDYYFYETAEFEAMIEAGEFLEHAIVYGQHKGIPKAHIRQAMASGKDAVMRVDVQGAETVKKLIPATVTIFLTCESEEELLERLLKRRTESEAQLQERLETVRREMTLIPNFDYVVVNHNDALDDTVDEVRAIIQAEHCRSVPQRIAL